MYPQERGWKLREKSLHCNISTFGARRRGSHFSNQKTHISDRNATTGNEDELYKSPPNPATREMLPVPEKPCLANKTSPSNFFSRRLFDENDEMQVSEEEGPTASDPAG